MHRTLINRTLHLLSIALAFHGLSLASEPAALTFERDIRPIFRTHCFDCHGATTELEGELDLRLVRFMEKGGESGAAIEKGDPDASYLLQRIKDGEMPPGEHPVPHEQVATLENWIRQGAPTARPEPETIDPGLGITAEERAYWAFQPINRPKVPKTKNDRDRTPIDAFLIDKMQPAKLRFAEDADKITLVRRAYIDLNGLPPTPEQVDAFLAADGSIDAVWEQLIDELLESPHYGERWGRHWLDVAGYADSEGVTNQDTVRLWSYKYRDWVIRAHNEDMPFDQFTVWQLAGDELAARPFKNMSPDSIDRLTATGFLRMAADGTTSQNNEETRNQVVTDTIKVVSSSLLGMSVGCAQCHDHRFDPISQEDYYHIRAVFEPALNYKAWKRPPDRRVSLHTDDETAKAAEIEAAAQKLVAARNKKQTEFLDAVLAEELEKIQKAADSGPKAESTDALITNLETAWRTQGGKRSDEQKQLLEDHPTIGRLSGGTLYQYKQANADELKKMDAEVAKVRGTKPKEEFLRILTEPTITSDKPDAIPQTHLFHRGDYRSPRHTVTPGGLSVMAADNEPFRIEPNDDSRETTGRRLAYARWLTNGEHPTLARVVVNRIWLNHFGQAFVATPDEFGKLGTKPTHPELLDWLADEFMSSGWSLKHMHRLIMTSTVYRQKAARTPTSIAADGSNQLYSHFPVQRLQAETLRDAILAISGRLDTKQFGPPVEVTPDDTGQVIVEGDQQRRSVYLQVRRTLPVAMLQSFDAPDMETNCALRQSTTAATQSLMLMNSDFILKFAGAFAKRLEKEVSNANKMHVNDRIVRGWRLAYGRAPDTTEIALALNYYHKQVELFKDKKHEKPEHQALTNYCQTLLSSNEFLYVD